jgi:hypothetical protein
VLRTAASRPGAQACVPVDGPVLGVRDTDKSNELSMAPLKVALVLLA